MTQELRDRLESMKEKLVSPAAPHHFQVKLIQGDALATLEAMPPHSVDLIFTNPPVEYHVNSFGRTVKVVFDTRWIREALRVSRGPVAYTLHADAFLWLWRAKDPALELIQPDSISAWVVNEPGVTRGVAPSTWNMLCLHKVPLRDPRIPDVIVAPAGDDHWGPAQEQAAPGSFHLAFRLIEFLKPETVLDPFCGSGVTLHAAEIAGALGAIGIDRDTEPLAACADAFRERGALVTTEANPSL